MSASTSELSLPHFLKLALAENGYATASDLSTTTAIDLAAELSIGIAQADDILLQASSLVADPSRRVEPRSQRASDLLHVTAKTRFSTACKALDDLLAHYSPLEGQAETSPNLKGKGRQLAGAVVPGMVLEISGPPGAGKSSVVLSLVLSGRLGPEPSEALIIDTEGSITPDRVASAARALLDSLAESKSESEEGRALLEDVLAGIHVTRVATQVQMVAVLHTVESWLEQHPKVKLVVIDTLSFHFRQPTLELPARKRIMELIKQMIGKAAKVRGCAVVATTQMATKLLTAENKRATFETGERAVLMPQLGDAWTTERTVRVALFRGPAGDDLRYAHASTASTPGSSRHDVPWASYDIDTSGLPCDMPPAPSDTD